MCKKYFFQTTSINYSGVIFQGKSPLSLIEEGFIQEQMFEGQTSRGQLPCEEFHEDNWTGENYSQIIVCGGKSPGSNCPEDIS